MDKKIVLLNGPPRSGKDTVSNLLFEYFKKESVKVEQCKFAQPIKDFVRQFYFRGDQYLFDWYDNIEKDTAFPVLYGKTCREIQIAFAETFLKQLHGQEIFGHLAIKRLSMSDNDIFIFSDCGFIEECIPLLDSFKKENIYLIKLYRENCSFSNDSRNYIKDDCFSCSNLDFIYNNGTLKDLEKYTLEIPFLSSILSKP